MGSEGPKQPEGSTVLLPDLQKRAISCRPLLAVRVGEGSQAGSSRPGTTRNSECMVWDLETLCMMAVASLQESREF